MATARRSAGSGSRRAGPVDFDEVRAVALALPGVEDGTSYGTPALKVGGRLLVRLREDGETIVLPVDFETREVLMRSAPETFFITEHYRNYRAVVARLDLLAREELPELLAEVWRENAPKRWLALEGQPRDR